MGLVPPSPDPEPLGKLGAKVGALGVEAAEGFLGVRKLRSILQVEKMCGFSAPGQEVGAAGVLVVLERDVQVRAHPELLIVGRLDLPHRGVDRILHAGHPRSPAGRDLDPQIEPKRHGNVLQDFERGGLADFDVVDGGRIDPGRLGELPERQAATAPLVPDGDADFEPQPPNRGSHGIRSRPLECAFLRHWTRSQHRPSWPRLIRRLLAAAAIGTGTRERMGIAAAHRLLNWNV